MKVENEYILYCPVLIIGGYLWCQIFITDYPAPPECGYWSGYKLSKIFLPQCSN